MERTIILIPGDIKTILPIHLPLNQHYMDTQALEPNSYYPLLNSMLRFKDEIDYEQVTSGITNQIKKRLIGRALQLTQGNKTKASKVLRLSCSGLWREMEKLKRWSEKKRSLSER